MTKTVVSPPRFEHHRAALGIGQSAPRLSWKIQGAPGLAQIAYEVEATRAGKTQSTGPVQSAEQVLVAWPFAPLASRESASVRVRIQAGDGAWSEWSQHSSVEAGLLQASDWLAVPVGPAWQEDPEAFRRPPLVRREFKLDKSIAVARLYVSAHGLYEVEINGKRVGDETLAPNWTVYGTRLQYATYDVTSLLAYGDNAIGAWLGDGWYRGRLGFRGGFNNFYGDDIGLIAQLEVVDTDGKVTTIATDAAWQAGFGPIIKSDLYRGEVYDAREERAGWSSPGFTGTGWSPVKLGQRDPATLFAIESPSIRCTDIRRAKSVMTTPSGKTVLDFGQNLVGRLRISVSGPAGSVVTLRHAEVMQDGEIYTRPLRTADATDSYTLKGEGIEVWEPRFTFHGFQYAEITGWPGAFDASKVEALIYHTDMERTGWLETSDSLLNQLHENIVWGMRGNFVGLPTDCPQRDERLGWTGDIQVFTPTATFLYDCSGFLGSWLRDLEAEQLEDGCVPWYVPVIPGGEKWTPIRPGAVWGDAAVLTPWVLYERFGDLGILATQYDSARRWVDLMDRLAGPDRLWNEGFQLGDWLDPSAPPDDPAKAMTDKYLIATAYYAWSTLHVAKMAQALSKIEDAARYFALAAEVKAAFAKAYILSDGRMTSDAQAAYALALQFDLYPDEHLRRLGGERVAQLVAEGGNRIGTGFAGTPVISDALSGSGHLSTAYDLLQEEECPSWLYTVKQGATTMWERWDSMMPDGTVNPGQMTSFNHYALGAVADWMHRTIGGIEAIEPGFRRIRIRPQPGGRLKSARARHESPYGPIAVNWTFKDGRIEGVASIPVGVTAQIELAGQPMRIVGAGEHVFGAALN